MLCRHFYIAEDRTKQPRADSFARVNGSGRGSAIRMLEEYMTAPSTFDCESGAFKRPNKFFALDAGQAGHTEICWIPTNSRESSILSPSSMQSSMTSRTRFINVSRVFACVWQPRKAGTEATYKPSSSRSITTVNFRLDFIVGSL